MAIPKQKKVRISLTLIDKDRSSIKKLNLNANIGEPLYETLVREISKIGGKVKEEYSKLGRWVSEITFNGHTYKNLQIRNAKGELPAILKSNHEILWAGLDNIIVSPNYTQWVITDDSNANLYEDLPSFNLENKYLNFDTKFANDLCPSTPVNVEEARIKDYNLIFLKPNNDSSFDVPAVASYYFNKNLESRSSFSFNNQSYKQDIVNNLFQYLYDSSFLFPLIDFYDTKIYDKSWYSKMFQKKKQAALHIKKMIEINRSNLFEHKAHLIQLLIWQQEKDKRKKLISYKSPYSNKIKHKKVDENRNKGHEIKSIGEARVDPINRDNGVIISNKSSKNINKDILLTSSKNINKDIITNSKNINKDVANKYPNKIKNNVVKDNKMKLDKTKAKSKILLLKKNKEAGTLKLYNKKTNKEKLDSKTKSNSKSNKKQKVKEILLNKILSYYIKPNLILKIFELRDIYKQLRNKLKAIKIFHIPKKLQKILTKLCASCITKLLKLRLQKWYNKLSIIKRMKIRIKSSILFKIIKHMRLIFLRYTLNQKFSRKDILNIIKKNQKDIKQTKIWLNYLILFFALIMFLSYLFKMYY